MMLQYLSSMHSVSLPRSLLRGAIRRMQCGGSAETEPDLLLDPASRLGRRWTILFAFLV